jgi:hypothetical protein
VLVFPRCGLDPRPVMTAGRFPASSLALGLFLEAPIEPRCSAAKQIDFLMGPSATESSRSRIGWTGLLNTPTLV